MIVKAIAKAVHTAEREKKKTAMFLYQVLIHAHDLRNEDAVEFCQKIKVQKSYATEFKKALRLATLMKEQDATIKIKGQKLKA